MTAFEIVCNENFSISLSNDPLSINESQQKLISEVWKNELKKNDTLHNGKVPCLRKIISQSNSKILKIFYVDYSAIIADRLEPQIGLDLKQVGVSGIIEISNNGFKKILFSTRSSNTTEYPDYLELVPSGNLEITDDENNLIDFQNTLINEFYEETRLSSDVLRNITPLCVVYDKINHVYDVCSKIQVESSFEDLLACVLSSNEYYNPKLIDVKDIENFISINNEKIIPTSKAILEYYMKLFYN